MLIQIHYVRMLFIIILCCYLISISCFAKNKVIINDVEWPPYFFIGANKQQIGLGKELINSCLHKVGYKAEYQRLPVKTTHQYMEKGEIDVTVYSYIKERERFLHYAKEPIFTADYVFMVRASSDIVINSLDDLAPYRIGYLSGLSYTPELLKIIKNKVSRNEAVKEFSLRSMFSQLLAPIPRFDIIADARDTFYWRAKKLGVSDKIKILNYQIKSKSYYITVSKQSKNITNAADFINNMDSCLQGLKQSGEYQSILANYGIQSPSKVNINKINSP